MSAADQSPGGQHRERGRWSRIYAAWSRLVARLPLGLALSAVAAVWAFGAVWSFTEQSAFARAKGFSDPALLPLVLDGLAVAMAGVAFAASLDARPAVGARLGTALAVLASASSNGLWAAERSSAAGAGANPALHSPDWTTVAIGAGIPIAANIAFEVLLGELRRQVQRRRGLPAPVALPSLRLLRLLLAPRSTFQEWRDEVLERTAPVVTRTAGQRPLIRLSVRWPENPAIEPTAGSPLRALEQGRPNQDGTETREQSKPQAVAETVEPRTATADQLQPDTDPRGESDPGSGQAGPSDPRPEVIDPGDESASLSADPGAADTEQVQSRAEPDDPSRDPEERGDERVRLLVGLLADRPAMKGPDAAEALAEAGMRTSYRTARRLLGEARDIATPPGPVSDTAEPDRDVEPARTGTEDAAGPIPLSLVRHPPSTLPAEGEPR